MTRGVGQSGRHAWLACYALLVLGACTTTLAPAFDARFPDVAVPAARPELRASPTLGLSSRSEPLLIAAALPTPQPGIALFDAAERKLRWRVGIAAESRPELAGDVVLTLRNGRLVALEARDGSVRFEADLGPCEYLGSARAEDLVVATCAPAHVGSGEESHASIVAFDARSGRRRWRRQAEGLLGRPTFFAGEILVPYQQQWISVLDRATGQEQRRFRVTDELVDWTRVDGPLASYGHRRIHVLSAPQDSAGAGARELRLDTAALPGQPAPVESAFLAQPAIRSARGRIALHVALAAGRDGALQVQYGHYYFVFYRYVFAYDASGTLRWVTTLPRDIVAGKALETGLFVALESGELKLLDGTTGAIIEDASMGVPITAASVGGMRVAPPRPVAAQTRSLDQSLAEVAFDTDARLVPARSYAVAQLAASADPEATRQLLRIYEQNSVPPELARAAADALRSRKVGLEYLIEALHAHYDFLEQTHPAPIAVIVPALVEAHEKRAVPVLLERLFDHETPLVALPTLVHGIVELGDASVVPRLFDWLRRYRADSTFAQDPAALLEAARGVALLGGSNGQALLRSLIQPPSDAFSPPLQSVATRVAELTQPKSSQPPPPAPTAIAAAPVAAAPRLPETLTHEAVAATFAEHEAELRRCIEPERAANPKLGQVRMVFIAESDGATHGWRITPDVPTLVGCLYPKVTAYRFPRFQSGRRVASYALMVLPDASADQDDDTSAPKRNAQWWSWYASHAAKAASGRATEPWWNVRQPLTVMVTRDAHLAARAAVGLEPGAKQDVATPTATDPTEAKSGADAWWLPNAPRAPVSTARNAAPDTQTRPAPPAAARIPSMPADAPKAPAEPPKAPAPEEPADDPWWQPAPRTPKKPLPPANTAPAGQR